MSPAFVARGESQSPAKQRKRQRPGDSEINASRLEEQRPDHVWELDLRLIGTVSGRKIKMLHVIDELIRESLA